ncbi:MULTISPECIES: pyrimidine 5'-nucleotidase [Paracoccaceae]|jgi:putative hydrolase of the HAD superfamily|uniref:pyrimidine 5'-nucleotidase n=1 Tax=Rhodobacterales TaxID=204455 RepID=UPI001B0A118B|nr:pyrimidine 5'-nucleotidase [Boseongicola sp. H5]MBO6603997.1 pyrimidine 5'-nucleotidase [Roseicyclus sp.]MBO6625582.1 pyrimidine 5'-nucleotidase [Roseicyclus sp.]MBO6921756.1 pyrimidine 5'-nucleotidase [Roseicyclus sp.]
MPAEQFHHIDTWVFDLDNTLYPPEMALFDQINIRMTAYVMEALGVDRPEADRLRRKYWQDHGTTLAGLMDLHGVDPGPYLHEVHEIDFTVLSPDPDLAGRIAALPGRRIVFTNGTAPYAERVLAHRGLTGLFDAIYGVEHANFRPKPEARAFEVVFATDGLAPTRSAMFEDEARNLAAPHDMGLRTVHVAATPVEEVFIDHHTDDLTGFLTVLTR